MSQKFKFQMYQHLQSCADQIYVEAQKAADDIGIPADLRGRFGLTGAISGCPVPLRQEIRASIEKGTAKIIPLAKLVEEIREIVKSVYGDQYDACPLNTCEAGLWASFDALFTPPLTGRGDNYRARYIVPYEKHLHHHGSYGRPFPGRFKDLFADRGSTPGEMGYYGKRQNNLDTVIVPLVGGRYEVHGIKYWPVPMLAKVDPEASIEKIAMIAERQAPFLTGFTSLAYETPGYGYAAKDEEGAPLLQKYLAELAEEFDLPYIQDNAWGLPFIGSDLRRTGADVIVYSMDKATGSATSGLIIGKEEYMVSVRRALGMHGDRWGTSASYGKAAYVAFDPGKEALLGQVAALRTLRDRPEILTKPVDQLYEVVKQEFAKINPVLAKGIVISKTYNSMAVEINYEGTWTENGLGIPIFSIEDMYGGSHLLQNGLAHMGIIPTICYDGNIFISPGFATTDDEGHLLEQRARWAVQGLVRLLEIIARYAGLI